MPIDTAHSSCTAREKHDAKEALEAKLMEGLDTIESELRLEDWRDIQAEALAVVDAQLGGCDKSPNLPGLSKDDMGRQNAESPVFTGLSGW
ncbi:hypothetical protein [Aquabacterium sp.]|uniref:hypothetical protein n=1 Tax=Aquabacterium sp. TaxID=1872578 RepID=UPI002486DE2B|nr:hypothetical protein [Aquabacterium sp.]MDI1259252.1 hypothetical protein [Aquabacterium sp.]